MSTEREAIFRLLTERGGDADAFESVAKELEAAGSSAERAKNLLDQIGSTEAGRQLIDEFKGAGASLEDFLAKFDTLVRKLENPIDLIIPDVTRQVEEFAEAAEKGGGNINSAAGKARNGLDNLQRAAEQLRASGKGLTDTQEAELRELEDAYDRAVQAAGRFKTSQAQANRDISESTRSFGELGGSVNSLGDILGQLNPRMQATVTRLGAIVGGLSAGYAAGTKFREGLAQLDEYLGTNLRGGLDSFVKDLFRMQEAMDLFVGAVPDAVAQSEELANIYHQLTAEGLRPAGLSLEEARDKLEALRNEQGLAARSSAELLAKTKEWAAGLGLSAKQIEEEAKNLESYLTELFSFAPDIDQAALGEKLKGQVQGMLDALKDLNVPDDDPVSQLVQRIAAEFGILDSETEAFVAQQERHYAAYAAAQREAFGIAAKLGPESRSQLAGLQKALDDLDFQEVSQRFAASSAEQQAQMTALVEQQISELRRLGGELTPAMQAVAGAVGLVVPAWEPIQQVASDSADALSDAAAAAKDAEQSLSGLGTGAADAGRGMQEGGAAAKEGADAFVDATEAAKEGAQNARDSTKVLDEQTAAASAVRSELSAATEALQQLNVAQEALGQSGQGAIFTMSGITQSAVDMVKSLEGLPDRLSDLLAAVDNVVGPIQGHLDQLRAKARAVNEELNSLEAGGGGGAS
ncbi:MAG: hypothetical protein AAGD06_21135 [Acidobacteriota bacterium]